MAKLYFYYSAMNAGKSTALLQANHNYQERGMETILLTAGGGNKVSSRLGISMFSLNVNNNANLFSTIRNLLPTRLAPIRCVLIDEAQFLTEQQVNGLCRVVDELNIPAMCYGLRTDFTGKPFQGASHLLAKADTISEIKTICECGSKATHVLRFKDGEVQREGEVVLEGREELYLSTCRKCHTKAMRNE